MFDYTSVATKSSEGAAESADENNHNGDNATKSSEGAVENADENNHNDENETSRRRRSTNRMFHEGKRLSWTDIQRVHDGPQKKKVTDVFSMHKYLSGQYDLEGDKKDDSSDWDPRTADPKEWQLSE